MVTGKRLQRRFLGNEYENISFVLREHIVLQEISPEYSLEGLILKLKLQYFGHQMRRTDSDAGKD